MSKLENLDGDMFQPLTDKESDAVLGGAFTYLGLTERPDGSEVNDYKSGDIIVKEPVDPVEKPSDPIWA